MRPGSHNPGLFVFCPALPRLLLAPKDGILGPVLTGEVLADGTFF